jgi:hypothetical protein
MDRPLNEGRPAEEQQLVLTPARLRIDSRVVATYTTGTWLMHAFFVVLLMLKVRGKSRQGAAAALTGAVWTA